MTAVHKRVYARLTGTEWNPIGSGLAFSGGMLVATGGGGTYDLGGYWRGQLPPQTDPIQRVFVPRNVTLEAGLPSALASCLVAPTGSVTLALKIAGTSVGSINFAGAATSGTFTFPTLQMITAGQIFEVDPPSPQDATFSDVSWTITGGATGQGFYDLGGYWRGQLPSTTDAIQRVVAVRTVTLQAGLPGSLASCVVAPTGNVTMALKANGVSIGSIDFATSATSGTFTFPSPVAIWSGQAFEVEPPSPQDATFSDVSWTVVGAT